MSVGTRVRARLARGGFRLDVDLAWDERVAVVFGPSGSGKSTLFELLLGFHPRAADLVRLGGELLDDAARGLHLPPERRALGWVPQDPLLLPHRTVRANLRLGAARGGAGGARALERAVEVLEIGELLDLRPTELSGGEQQRVAIARALVNEPPLLLADEPTGNLDPDLSLDIMDILADAHARGTTVIVATHDPKLLERYRFRHVTLEGGRVMSDRKPEALFPALRPAART